MQKQGMGMKLELTQKPTITIVQMNCSDFMSCYECYASVGGDDLLPGKVELQCSTFKVIERPLEKRYFAQTGPSQPDDIYF